MINGFTEVLLQKREYSKDCLERIKGAGERAAALTRQLLAFGRKQILQVRELDLNAVIQDLAKMLPRLIGEDIKVVIHADPQLGCVRADPGQIEQILLNLATNARDAMSDGGVFAIATANVEFDASTIPSAEFVPGSYVQLTVSDTGAGMDEATKARIFEPFFTTKAVGKGTGLGLATVYGIVKQSNGFIEVDSEPNHGTTFRIYLLRQRETEQDVPDQAAPAVIPQGKETVLLVEDEDAVRNLLSYVLQSNGYQVLEASSGSEALEHCNGQRIDLLVTDVIMPKMNGRQLAEQAMCRMQNLRVLYMSGYTDRVLDQNNPGTWFLQKPISMQSLTTKVRAILDSPQF